ncbi:MAG: Fe-S-cluster-containing dehydrogenase component [Candidatus Methanohalarchaeum thermophilum]|uniref:Fe-S-cluster-containing dehydrogenase component n=1 Tax=Methanohalarchaeum thermophilum TaxID=1903181 RepID=A0A1Q6DUM2_METT1|nr:MAG: Fe-S-cluster-containing dehydrogenase component [Candidatus Methanohalarchaeum thermophilum]
MSKKYSRRDFIKGSVLTTAGAFGLTSISLAEAQEEVDGPLLVINPSECKGCDVCLAACEDYHQNYYEGWGDDKPGTYYSEVLGINENEIKRRRNIKNGERTNEFDWSPPGNLPHRGKQFYLPIQCMHCNDAPCEDACLGNAISTTDKGKVVIDHESCIGCLSCVSACPFSRGKYQTIKYSMQEKKVFKCDMCERRLEDGKNKPACVEICPTDAKLYGPGSEMLEEALKIAEDVNGAVLYPEETSVLFILDESQVELLSELNLMEEEYPNGRLKASVLNYSNYGFIPLLLGFLGFTFVYKSKKTENIVKASNEGEENG